MIALADIWGIGPRTFAKLTALGVTTPLQLAERIYRPGILFKKSGVILSDIVPGRLELSQVLDGMNHKYGVRTVGLAGAGGERESWKTKKEHSTPNYLTDIDQIMTVNI